MIDLKRIMASILVVASLALGQPALSEPISATVGDLLRAPAQFDRKRIFVRGYYVGTFGESRLYASAKDAAHRKSSNNVWIDQSVWGDIRYVMGQPRDCIAGINLLGIDKVEDLTERDCKRVHADEVRLVGTFRILPANGSQSWPSPFGCAFDWTGSSPYAITNVTYFRAIKVSAIDQQPCGCKSAVCNQVAHRKHARH